MADGFFNAIDGVEAKSAGTRPEQVNPLAVSVMSEVGIDIHNNESNHVEEYLEESFDYVLTVCDSAEQNCPVYPRAGQKLHQAFEDPAKTHGSEEEILEKFREVRDSIKEYVSWFLKNVSA